MQIKSSKGLAGKLALQKPGFKAHCYPFVIRFSGFTHPSDGICADNAVHFRFADLYRVIEEMVGEALRNMGDPPIAIVTRAWRQYISGNEERIDRKAFVFCFLDRLRSAPAP
ncbi:MAG: hypothetical protein JO170_22460 [Verrucomicrobia bacterium]|nr:hypothetical protein [Verrucomicrobiota bacterium]